MLLVGFVSVTQGYAQLTTAREVRSLTLEETEVAPSIHLRAVVTFADPPSTIFVQDETAGTFFRLDSRTPPRAGDEVEVRGKAFPGLYLPGIEETSFEVVGHPGIPDPIPANYDDLISGKYHYQRVAVEGVVRTVELEDEAGTLARIALGSRILEVHVEQPPQDRNLEDSRVRVAGLAAGHINSRRQLVEPYLRCADWSEFEILKSGPVIEAIPEYSSAEVLNFSVEGQGGHRVKMTGTVLANFPRGSLFLRDAESAINVQLLSPAPGIQPGDRLSVIGYPEMSGFSASLADASVIERSKGDRLPEATGLSMQDLLDGTADGDLVSVEAELVDIIPAGSGGFLTLQQNGMAIQAKTPFFPEDIVVGSRVEATGILRVETTQESSYSSRPETVSLQMRSRDDFRVVARPGWWTAQRLAVASIGLLIAVAIAGLWIGLLRRQVARQTIALRDTIEHEAALEERQRIAREFHDTLEQELAGLSLRLDAAVAHGAQEKLKGLLEGSRNLVSRIQLETRNLVSDLRDTAGGSSDVEAALRELVDGQPSGIGPEFSLVAENVPELPPRTVHHLKMIARETIANALKHSGAEKIELRVGRQKGALALEIIDDGAGFDTAEKTRGMPGHFGCMGIRERCKKIHATVEWRSEPGKGTTVFVEMPI